MILLEKIEGHTMLHANPSLYSESACMDAVARIMEAFTRIAHAGIHYRDVYQRNFMLCDGVTDAQERIIDRIVVIDFNFAVVDRLDDFEEWGLRLEKLLRPLQKRRYERQERPQNFDPSKKGILGRSDERAIGLHQS